jgi:peroxiredoxin
MELEALQEIHSEVRALGAQIVVITPELQRYTRALHKKLNLTFYILTDLHLKLAEQFRPVFALPNYLRDLYKSFGSTLDRFNDEPEYRLPMPARYVIDKQGIIGRTVLEGSRGYAPQHTHPLHSTAEGTHRARSWLRIVARRSVVSRSRQINASQ